MFTSFLVEDEGPIDVPLELGAFPYLCVGDVNECADGLTYAFWFVPPEADPSLPTRYILSTGGQSGLSTGIYVRQNFGMEYEVGSTY